MNDDNRRMIWYWHGKPYCHGGQTHPLVEKVETHCIEDEDGNWWWIGSLDEFAGIFEQFMLIRNRLAITQHNNFNAR